MTRKVYIQNIPLEDAQSIFNQQLEENGFFSDSIETVRVEEALWRITAQPVNSVRSVPHYLASAMDGIAVRSNQTAGAGETRPITLACGSDYYELDTGDPVPEGFDSVIMIEDVVFEQDDARIIKAATPWQHVRPVGEDLVSHDLILPSYCRIGPYEKAAFLNAGVKQVEVLKRPTVAIIPTGTELIEHTRDHLEIGEITETNSYMLAGLVEECGGTPIQKPIVVDDYDLIKTALSESIAEADIVIICSGSSAGREDFSAAVVDELGDLLVHGVAIKPGKPAILGMVDKKAVIGVPGYPVSASLVFRLFVKPLIYRLLKQDCPEDKIIEASMSRKTASPMGVDEYVHVNLARFGDRYLAYPLSRGAGISSMLVKADGYTIISRGWEGINRDDRCSVALWRTAAEIDRSMVCIGSHDFSVDILIDLLKRRCNLRLSSNNAGSMGGIMALKNGETHFAGIHLLDATDGSYNISFLKKYLPNQPWLLVHIARRQQGLLVLPDNPLNIKSLEDICQVGARYINRQKGSGTRILLDYILEKENLSPALISGYSREVYNHLSVGAAIKDKTADAGLAIYAAARALDLDFIPVAEESYDICILPDLCGQDNLKSILDAINSPQFRETLEKAGGYRLDDTGRILCENNS